MVCLFGFGQHAKRESMPSAMYYICMLLNRLVPEFLSGCTKEGFCHRAHTPKVGFHQKTCDLCHSRKDRS